MKRLSALVFVCILLAVSPHRLAAQSASGQITGVVTDPSGASVPSVEVTLTNQQTAITQRTTTTGPGDYTFPVVPVGTYTVSIESKGFRSYRRTGIQVNVNQTVRVDMELQVGQVSEQVEVSASAISVDTDTATLGQSVDQKQVTELPLNGRNFLDLLFLGNGAVTPPNGEQGSMRQGQGNAISINGARPESNNYMLDGVSITDTSLVTPAVVLSIDAIQEFKEQTAIYSAEYGFSANQINVISKSGTNELHGALFWFDRNNDFDARSFFDSGIPALHQNQFGFVAGGPVIIPKLYNGKNKTFWIANYEGLRLREGSVQKGIVPNANQLGGQFTNTIIDPTTGQPFPNNTIPTSRFSRLANVALQSGFWPSPNYNQGGNNYYSTVPSPTDSDQQTYRLDQSLGKFGTIFGRGTYTNYLNTGAGFTPRGDTFFNERAISWQVNHNVSIGPHLVNSFKIGHLDAVANQYGVAQPESSVTAMGFSGLYQNLPDVARTWPSIGMTGFAGVGGAVNAYTTSDLPMWDTSDSLTYIKGSHTITMGANFRHWVSNRQLADNFLGNYTFAGYFTNPNPQLTPTNDNVVADMLLGYFSAAANFQPAAFSTGSTVGNPHSYVFNYFAPFVQDDWKVNNRLTLNLGLRWDYRSIPYATNNRMFWLDTSNPKGGLCFADKALLTDGVAGDQSYYRYCGSNTPGTGSKTPFAPRIGFAYRPFGGDKTVVRGGYGIFFDSTESREIDDSGDLYPYVSRTNLTQSYGQSAALLTTNQLFPPLTAAGAAVPADNTFIAVIISEAVRNPYIQQWNFSIERALSSNSKLEVYYLGTKGTHLLQRRNIAQALPPSDPNNPGTVLSRRPYPNFATYIDSDWSGYSKYHSFNVKYEANFKGLIFTSNYTWSKSLDDKSSIAALGNSSDGWQGFLNNHNTRLDYGLSDFNVPHRFVTSFVYNLPFGRGQKFASTVNRAANLAIGGWQVNGIVNLQKGFPYSIFAADANGLLDGYFNRANVVGNPWPSGFQQNIYHWFNTAAFAQPQAGVYGAIGRNVYTGPGLSNWDASLFKNLNFTERLNLQLRLETFNTFNHAQWSTPNFSLTSPSTFGTISGTQVPGRIAQVGVKLLF